MLKKMACISRRLSFLSWLLPLLGLLAVVLVLAPSGAGASPSALHVPQYPDPNGWAVRWPGSRMPLGDDWRALTTGPVDEVHMWLAWKGDAVAALGRVGFAIWSDAGGAPGQVLWASPDYAAGDYTLSPDGSGLQGWYDPEPSAPQILPNDHSQIYRLDIENIQAPFVQQQGQTYWLVSWIGPEFGVQAWKAALTQTGSPARRPDNFPNWAAVTDPQTSQPLDLAFVLGSLAPDEGCPATIRSVRSGNWRTPATWDLGRLPNASDTVMVAEDHIVNAPNQIAMAQLCNYGTLRNNGADMFTIRASGFISNYGQIVGSDGLASAGTACGEPGTGLTLYGKPILNEGTIQAGDGGSGAACGGNGGSTIVYGRDTINSGTICAGKGGRVAGTAPGGQGGAGGDTHIWGKKDGPGKLVNTGLACAGDGGSGNAAATGPQEGGSGGTLKLISMPSLFLAGGRHYAGKGGLGTGGGRNGRDGLVYLEPNTISLADAGTLVWGGEVVISGGSGWILDLSGMSDGAISATGGMTVAVGAGGSVDLTGGTGQVLQAAGGVHVAADQIILDPGETLADVAGSGATSGPSQIWYEASLLGPERARGAAGETLRLELMLLNEGAEADEYDLDAADSQGWPLSGLPASQAVPALDGRALSLDVTIPISAGLGTTDLLTVTARSQGDPGRVAQALIEVQVRAKSYLPLVLRR